MPITEKTRKARVTRWTALKRAWQSKLKKASNENDTTVAKAMIAEAEETITRLEVKGEAKEEKKSSSTEGVISTPKKRITKTDTYLHKAKDSSDTTGTIGP